MLAYIARRLILILPTLLGIMIINFLVIQAAPGGPVEQALAQFQGNAMDATARISGAGSGETSSPTATEENDLQDNVERRYRGSEGLDEQLIAELEALYGFDKPPHIRFFQMLGNYARFNFGESFFKGQPVTSLVLDKMPVSISLGVWTTLLVYIVSIPLGIRKAVKDGMRFDVWSSTIVIIGNAIPGFLFAILLIIMFAGGRYFDWFPLRGLTSNNWEELSTIGKVLDYLWHITLPVLSMVIGGFAGLTLLTKNSFLEEINKQYVMTARAKGAQERKVLYGHVFRNAMLIVIAGFPSAFVGVLFTGSLLTEIIFSLDGLGLLGYEAALTRDYPIMFATLYFFTLLGLVMQLIGDLTYTVIDPRIDFEAREV
ncbi:MAG: microcin C ABC transporter permease YejB [Deinococcota bacterium]